MSSVPGSHRKRSPKTDDRRTSEDHGHPASEKHSGRRTQSKPGPQSLHVAQKREEGETFACLFQPTNPDLKTLSDFYRAYVKEGGDESQRPVLREDLVGSVGPIHDLWNAFIMVSKPATDLLAASLVNGKFWAPRSHAVTVMKDTLRDREFGDLFTKVDKGPFKTYFTETDGGLWDQNCTEQGLETKSAGFANHFILQISILIEDDKGDFVSTLRTLGYEYLIKYPISGAVFPGKFDVGAKTIRDEAKRLLDPLCVESHPFHNNLLLVIFTSECCIHLAKRLIYTVNARHVATGMRRASIVPAESADRKKCELSFAVLAHAAAILISWLKLLSVCTADTKTREFSSKLARCLTVKETEDLSEITKCLVAMQYLAQPGSIGHCEEYSGLRRLVSEMDEDMELWAIYCPEIYMPAN